MRISTSAALAALCLLLASTASAQARLQSVDGESRVVWTDGSTLRATAARVDGFRSIALEDGALVATWNETDASGRVPYYAISLDGAHVGLVTATSYELGLRRGEFDPLLDAPSFADSPFASRGQVYIVQYVTQPLLAYSDAITARGGRVYDFLERHAHLVRMGDETRAAVARLPFVRWIGAYHPEFRVAPELLAPLRDGSLPTQRYNIQVFERGAAQQEAVAARIAQLGGTTHSIVPEGYRMEATLSSSQLLAVAALDEVRFVDLWGAPEEDMDIAREISGANYVEATPGNFLGQGVNAEVLDGGADLTHPDLANHVAHGSVSGGSHGTCTSGIVCGSGAGNPQARGVMPSARLVSGDYDSYAGGNRYVHTAQLVDPAQSFQCVLQSNSWGDPLTTSYTTISSEMDDIIALNDFLICQSQSNNGNTQSRPQAWAKNIVSVGGIRHQDTLTRTDDTWNNGASIGPAADGRLKPDLSHFYDSTLTTDVVGSGGYVSGNYYTGFGGTSGATPITAGHFGLFFQMWHAGVFGAAPGGASVFASRPHFTLAKAALINSASAYAFSGTSSDLTRTHQGWGLSDLRALYDLRQRTFFVDQTDVVQNLGSVNYNLTVAAGEPALRVTLVYRDAMGTVAATQHRKNDLTLRVTAPDGTSYYGNNGLASGNWSTPGGVANTKDTVENVFVQSPLAGIWTVEVRGDNVNTDPVTNTPSNTADFALWASGVTGATSCTGPATYCSAKLNSSFTMPAIGFTGTASLAAGNFEVTLTNGIPHQNGLVFWGLASQSTPFKDGLLCVTQPLIRNPIQTLTNAGGATRPIAIDASMVGTTRFYQWWFRDPSATFTIGLSDALQVTFCD